MSQESPSPPSPARRRPRRMAWRLLFALLATLVGLELGYRALLALRGEPYHASAALASIRQLGDVHQRDLFAPELAAQDATDARDGSELLLHPYLGFAPRGKTLQLSRELVRQRRGAGAESLDVLLLGGSVAGQFYKNGTELLFERLRADPGLAGRELHCAPFSTGAYKQPQQAIRLVELLHLGYEPDLVLLIDGFNELMIGTANAVAGTNPYYPAGAQWAHLAQGGVAGSRQLEAVVAVELARRELSLAAARAEALGLYRSAVLGRLALARLEAQRAEEVRCMEVYQALLGEAGENEALRGPEYAKLADERLRGIVSAWEEASRTMHDICAARGIPVVHVLQPALHDEGAKPLHPKEREIAARQTTRFDAVREGYPLMREAGARLRAHGVRFVDASDLFADDSGERFFDPCHFDPTGAQMMAERIAPEVLASLAD